ncbi:MAG: SagB/ThcOx family dehydrogenase [Proteobacteria bacterium]|nr:SagB/ThcOx family dehydrogenase [Pseudomonadota bacterium]MBI3496651.1 SagB/ThcOx family dehydrogenase [Pseudomonadota bacterium]
MAAGGDLCAEEIVAAYHERTKHHHHRYAASLDYLDWATQPDPFRRYHGAPLLRLPLLQKGRVLPYWQLYVTDTMEPAPLSIESISLFFRYALSLTAWKRFRDTTWSLRANPSSGNLHPTEGYALLPALCAVHDRPGVYHYAPQEHGLERRADLDPSVWTALMGACPEGAFLVGLSSIHWREAWKYGERAFRYCQHDVGHALGTMRYAAAALGWKLHLLDHVSDTDVSRLLGLDRAADYVGVEREHPELLALVVPGNGATSRGLRPPEETLRELAASRWYGTANALSPEHSVDWPVIDLVALAASREANSIDEEFSGFPSEGECFMAPVRSGAATAERVILGRRSAVSMDASTAISAATFFRMLARLVPIRDGRSVPWDAIPWRPRIHLGLFVHRVNDLSPGLYALARDPEKVEPLRQAMGSEFLWRRPPSCPRGLPLYLLKEGDCRALAASVSCGQDIAGDGAFSLGMIADFMDSLVTYGAAFYRNLFWEAGLVGQVLYLEAEEACIRSTGIGCYFDDPVHEVFGISSRDWQSFYHFTVGGPVEDKRLTTLPAYKLEEER